MSEKKSFASIPGVGRLESLRLFYRHDKDYSKVYVELWKRFGYVFYVHMPMKRYLFLHPDHVKHILKDNWSNYKKSSDYDSMRMGLGEGLVTSEGETWRRNRTLLAPEFQNSNNLAKIPIVVKETKVICDLWEACAEYSQAREIHKDMLEVGFQIVGEAFFGEDIGKMSGEAGEALINAVERASERMLAVVKFPTWFPTPLHRSYAKSLKVLDRIIDEIYKNRSARKVDHKDFVSRLLHSVSDLKSEKEKSKLIHDELMTLLVAAHETTAATMSWTLWLLCKNPEVEKKLWTEVNQVLGGRSPTADDLPNLQYTRMVLQETLRIMAVVPMLPRVAVNDDIIGDYKVPAGTVVTCAQAVTHIDPAFWPNPESFIPERFEKSAIQKQYPYSYFPFGAGPRICLGEGLSMTTMTVMLSMFVQRFQFKLDPNHEVVSHAVITMRPKHGIMVFPKMRKPELVTDQAASAVSSTSFSESRRT